MNSAKRATYNFYSKKFHHTIFLAGLFILALIIYEIVIPSGLKPWSYAVGEKSNYFLDLIGRVSNINQLHVSGNVYLNFGHLAFTYPPAAIFLFFWITIPTQIILIVFWTILNAICLFLIITKGITFVNYRKGIEKINLSLWLTIGAILLVPPIYECFALGQIGLILFYLTFIDYFSESNKLNGVFLGIAAGVKLYPVLFIFAWISQKKYKESITAITTAVMLNLLAYFIWPSSSMYFFKKIIFGGAEISHLLEGIKRLGSSSVISPLIRSPFNLGSENKLALIGLIATYALITIFISLKLHNEGYVLTAFIVIAFTSATCSIVTWDHYFVFIILIPFAWKESLNHQTFRVLTCISLAIFVYPWWRFRFWTGTDVLSKTVIYISTNALLFSTFLYIFGSLLLLINKPTYKN